MTRPNLFDHGTPELTQDAVLCWLLAWADADCERTDPLLHAAGRAFVAALLASARVAVPGGPYAVFVARQEAHVDITFRVGTGLLISIEDKTESGVHGDQLDRYLELLGTVARREKRQLVPIYLRTGEFTSGASQSGLVGWCSIARPSRAC